MLKKIIIIVICALPLFTKAQVTINAQLPPGGFVQKEQLWNIILVNNNADVLDVSIQLNLQDAFTGEVVLTAITGNIILAKGVKLLKAGDVQPISYNYTQSDLFRNYLPMGGYIACYRIINNKGRKDAPLTEECIRVNIDPLSPPMLNSPADKEEIATPYPQFSWMPPTPFEMFSNLNYDILITEVLQGQSPTEAIQYNTPIYTKGNIVQPYESYAGSFTKLDAGKIYAWQVIARNGMNYSAKTEVWTFTIGKNKIEKRDISNSYVSLKNSGDDQNIYYLKDDKLSIRFYSFEKDFTAKIKILTTDLKIVDEINQKILYGDNFFNLKTGQKVKDKQLYLIELLGKDGIKHTALFSLKN